MSMGGKNAYLSELCRWISAQRMLSKNKYFLEIKLAIPIAICLNIFDTACIRV